MARKHVHHYPFILSSDPISINWFNVISRKHLTSQKRPISPPFWPLQIPIPRSGPPRSHAWITALRPSSPTAPAPVVVASCASSATARCQQRPRSQAPMAALQQTASGRRCESCRLWKMDRAKSLDNPTKMDLGKLIEKLEIWPDLGLKVMFRDISGNLCIDITADK